jgi:hypothetical protein
MPLHRGRYDRSRIRSPRFTEMRRILRPVDD